MRMPMGMHRGDIRELYDDAQRAIRKCRYRLTGKSDLNVDEPTQKALEKGAGTLRGCGFFKVARSLRGSSVRNERIWLYPFPLFVACLIKSQPIRERSEKSELSRIESRQSWKKSAAGSRWLPSTGGISNFACGVGGQHHAPANQ